MTPEEQLRQAVSQREAEEEERGRRYREQSRRRLLRILERKLNTSFIGALSKFETFFGHLWGHRQDEASLTPDQRRMRELWALCRTDVLNNGNNQLRAVQSEVAQYTVTWDAYQVDLPVVGVVSGEPEEGR